MFTLLGSRPSTYPRFFFLLQSLLSLIVYPASLCSPFFLCSPILKSMLVFFSYQETFRPPRTYLCTCKNFIHSLTVCSGVEVVLENFELCVCLRGAKVIKAGFLSMLGCSSFYTLLWLLFPPHSVQQAFLTSSKRAIGGSQQKASNKLPTYHSRGESGVVLAE